jgi:hypothetical protein
MSSAFRITARFSCRFPQSRTQLFCALDLRRALVWRPSQDSLPAPQPRRSRRRSHSQGAERPARRPKDTARQPESAPRSAASLLRAGRAATRTGAESKGRRGAPASLGAGGRGSTGRPPGWCATRRADRYYHLLPSPPGVYRVVASHRGLPFWSLKPEGRFPPSRSVQFPSRDPGAASIRAGRSRTPYAECARGARGPLKGGPIYQDGAQGARRGHGPPTGLNGLLRSSPPQHPLFGPAPDRLLALAYQLVCL